jgi:hypothetical protein
VYVSITFRLRTPLATLHPDWDTCERPGDGMRQCSRRTGFATAMEVAGAAEDVLLPLDAPNELSTSTAVVA